MRFTGTFWAFFFAFLALAALHNVAVHLYLYWTYLWFDIPMHVLGGVVVALGYLTLLLYLSPEGARSFRGVGPTLIFVLLVGLVWEAFEILIDIPFDDGYVRDTVTDLCMDMLGGVVGHGIARRLGKHA